MAKIDELLQELCPDGVECLSLGSIGKICMCKRIMKDQTNTTSGVPFYKIGTFGKEADAYISYDLYKEYKHRFSFPQKGYVLISASGTIGRAVIYNGEDAYFQDSNIVWIENREDIVLNKYLYYCYMTMDWVTEGGTIKRLYNSNLAKMKIFVPSLSRQQEIVEVLDTFTDAISNLEEELALREKQFEYYREHLYQFDDECSIKTIKDISVKCFPGATPSTKKPEYWQNGTIPWMSSGEIHQGQVKSIAGRITQLGYDSSSTKMVPINSIVVALAGQGKTRGTVAITRMELCTNQSLCAIIPDQSMVVPEYLYFYLKGQYFNLRQVSAGDGTRGGLTLKHIESYKVPVISLDRQHKIVEILDTFEAMIANIKEEIALRTKQYEYYREKLLSFGK